MNQMNQYTRQHGDFLQHLDSDKGGDYNENKSPYVCSELNFQEFMVKQVLKKKKKKDFLQMRDKREKKGGPEKLRKNHGVEIRKKKNMSLSNADFKLSGEKKKKRKEREVEKDSRRATNKEKK